MSLAIPVGFIIFNRPDLTEKVFSAIAKAKPKKLFVVADGPRFPEEAEKCEKTRAVIQKVDWDCEIFTKFSDQNLGCGRGEATAFDWVFSQVEEAIFLEDDTLPCQSFFSFCETMLDRYRHDKRIMHINGDNSVNKNRTEDSYYFSKYIHGWGWASWRRAWKYYDYYMKSWPEFKNTELMDQIFDDPFERNYWENIFGQMHKDPQVIDTWDYQWIYACWSQSGMAIAPNKNLVSNIGFNRPDAAHTLGDDPRSNLPTSAIEIIKHPQFFVRHKQADQHSFDHIFGGIKLREQDKPLATICAQEPKQIPINVLHINQSDIIGGAGIAGYRLHQGLLAQGHNSKLLVGKAKTIDHRVAVTPRKPYFEKQLNRITAPLGLNYLHLIASFSISKHDFFKTSDILNFHNLHYDYYNYAATYKLTKEKPAVFTLHDMWSFTGHCAYSKDCNRWKKGCGNCPYPDTYPDIQRDNTHIEWKLKNWIFRHSNLTIVTPSRWMTEQVRQSMLNCFAIHCIPYGVDTDVYRPNDPKECRFALGIPENKKILLFCAECVDDLRKGPDLLAKAIQKMSKSLKDETVMLTMGYGGEEVSKTLEILCFNLGYVNDETKKAAAYCAADLLVFPTRNDNLPLVLQESMACGTPMVSFNVGGVSDLVRPGITGYLASPEDADDFCYGIEQLLQDKDLLDTMGKNCREIALQEYPLALQAKRYIDLYQKLLSK